MANYFECTVRYERQTGNETKKVTESYLVDAIGFGEAEERITKEISCFASGEFHIVSVKRYNIQEIVFDNNDRAEADDKWYRVKINLITLDEKTKKEKKAPIYLLIHTGSVYLAQHLSESQMKGSISDYVIENIVETKLLDVFFYKSDRNENDQR